MSETVLDRLGRTACCGPRPQCECTESRRRRCCGRTKVGNGCPSSTELLHGYRSCRSANIRPLTAAGRHIGFAASSRASIDAGLQNGIPVVYLPGVSRTDLELSIRARLHLAPLAELQYRSQWFSHPKNNRDWSVRALLSHPDRGLGLHIADDADTSAALLLALDRLLDERVDRLTKQVLDADFFHDLINPDPVRSVLGWLDDPAGFRPRMDDVEWPAFVQQCKADYGFDPIVDGEVTAARKLAGRDGAWAHVWKRFAETPERYPGITDQLRKARPTEQLALGDSPHSDVWPQDNETAEVLLRNVLRDFDGLTAEGARKEIIRLEGEHAWRRSTVWADLEMAPLAFALEQLVNLAELTSQPPATGDLTSLISDHAERGWKADDAVLRALAAAKYPSDRESVAAAVAAIYRSWLELGAKTLQEAIGPMANVYSYTPGPPASTAAGTVTVFVDGLRLDVAHRVEARLASVGLHVDANTSLAALPTVTETAKPALTPMAPGALSAGPDLHPANRTTGTKASIQVLRSLMRTTGCRFSGRPRLVTPPVRDGLKPANWITEATTSGCGWSTTLTKRSTGSSAAFASCSTPAGTG